MFNLYDLTNGTYRVFRVVSYPDYPESLILFDVDVKADDSEWATTIYLNGAYSGPTDAVASKDYQIRWMVDGRKLLELGTVDLELSSGERLRQNWSSIITPTTDSGKGFAVFERFPSEGELVDVSISPFERDGNTISYEWDGTVRKAAERD